jgi:ubiquinone/menaquinone biosynthesis C-methylase UbiE
MGDTMNVDVKEIIRTHWNGRAAHFDSSPNHAIATREEQSEWLRMFSSFIGDEQRRVLDIGTGTGEIALLLAKAGHNVTGIDLADNMLSQARSKAASRGLKAEFMRGDAEHLLFANETFDAVVNRHLLWTLPHAEQALKEWHRVLTPGGKLVIVDGDWSEMKNEPPKTSADGCTHQPSLDAYRTYHIDDALPMQQKERPEADIAMLESLGFSVEVKWIGLGKDFFQATPYGDGVERKRFVLYAQKHTQASA